MSPLTLRSSQLRATILPNYGARLASLTLCSASGQEQELLWQQGYENADSRAWQHGGLPLLFPFAGRVWDAGELGFYRPSPAQRFALPLHGFAHYLPWQQKSVTASEAVLSLSDTEHTRSLYPWRFYLTVCWRLEATAFEITLTSSNLGCLLKEDPGLEMPFAAGLHPYFAVPAQQEGFVRTGPCQVQAVTAAGAAGELLDCDGKRRGQNLEVAKTSSVILRDFVDPEVTLCWGSKSLAWNIRGGEQTRCFVLWSDRKDEYFCAEPWMGLPDALASGYGVQRLAKGAALSWRVRFDLIDPAILSLR